jgi:hypothetical protein
VVRLRLPRNWVGLRLQIYYCELEPYIKEELRSALIQYKCTEASYQLSELKTVGLLLRFEIFNDFIRAIFLFFFYFVYSPAP